eukprot:UN28273
MRRSRNIILTCVPHLELYYDCGPIKHEFCSIELGVLVENIVLIERPS